MILVDEKEWKETKADAARYLWLLGWYLQGRSRSEINPLGHIMTETPLIIDACIDAEIAKGTRPCSPGHRPKLY